MWGTLAVIQHSMVTRKKKPALAHCNLERFIDILLLQLLWEQWQQFLNPSSKRIKYNQDLYKPKSPYSVATTEEHLFQLPLTSQPNQEWMGQLLGKKIKGSMLAMLSWCKNWKSIFLVKASHSNWSFLWACGRLYIQNNQEVSRYIQLSLLFSCKGDIWVFFPYVLYQGTRWVSILNFKYGKG